jgi:DNA-binding MarR family transcriptional regulator
MDEFQWGEIRIEDAALAGGFVQLPAVVVFDADLSSGAKITYGALLWYGWKYHHCPEQRVMAADIGVSLRTVQGHVAELERRGYIEVVQLGLGRPNAYIIKTLEGRENHAWEPPNPEPQKTAVLARNHDSDPVSDLDSAPEAVAVLEPQKTAVLARKKLRFKDAENCGSNLIRRSRRSRQEVTTRQQQQDPQPLVRNAPSQAPPGRGMDRSQDVVVASLSSHPTADDTADGVLTRLLNLGVARSTAKSLLKHESFEEVCCWVDYTEQKLARGWVPRQSPAAWLVSALRSGDWVLPDWFVTPQEEVTPGGQQVLLAAEEEERRQKEAEEETRKAEQQRRALEAELGVGKKTRDTWEEVKQLLLERGQFTVAYHSAYLLPLKGSVATLATPVQFFCDVIEKRTEALREAICEVSGKRIESVEVKVFTPTTEAEE